MSGPSNEPMVLKLTVRAGDLIVGDVTSASGFTITAPTRRGAPGKVLVTGHFRNREVHARQWGANTMMVVNRTIPRNTSRRDEDGHLMTDYDAFEERQAEDANHAAHEERAMNGTESDRLDWLGF